MGPRRCRRGRRRSRETVSAMAGFNGATPMSAWKTLRDEFLAARPRASMGPRRCRRGRRGPPAHELVLARRASMGPRRCRRGRPAGRTCTGTRASSFNGATPMSAWKTLPAGVTRSSRSGFNGATPMSAWKTGPCWSMIPGRISFNGATPMSAWKTTPQHRGAAAECLLQWGHADVGVEDRSARRVRVQAGRCFNGATPMSAWKTPSGFGGRTASASFNGATPMSAWKTIRWIRAVQHDPCFNGATPMSAWKTGERWASSAASSFNGATPMSAWKTMKPVVLLTAEVVLQWGHADVGVED